MSSTQVGRRIIIYDSQPNLVFTELVHERSPVPVDAIYLAKKGRCLEVWKSLLDGVANNDTTRRR